MVSTQQVGSERVPAREWRLMWMVILAILAITSIPYVYGYLSSPPDKQFVGLLLNVPDHAQYMSWWRGFQTSLLIPNRLTPELNRPVFFNLLWWILAQLTRLTGVGFAPLYQLTRWIAGAAFLWVAFRLCTLFFTERVWRWTAFLLIAFSSGFGWVLIVAKYLLRLNDTPFPLDVYIAEGNSFLCILGYPHFALAAAFMLGALGLAWWGWRTRRWRYPVLAAIIALLLGLQHAYDLILVYGVLGAFALAVWVRDRRFPWFLFWSGLIIGALSGAPAVYSYWLTTAEPLWDKVLAQFANAGVYTPNLLHLLILMGIPLIVTALTFDGLVPLRQWDDRTLFVKVWFVAGFVLAYIPTDFQIHMLNGWQVPVMLLATRGLYQYIVPAISEWPGLKKLRMGTRPLQWGALIVCWVAVIPTNLYLLAWRFVDLHRHDYPYYLYRDELAALVWLDQHASDDDVILSSITVGQYIPGYTNSHAFLAHWAQTVDYYDKEKQVHQFFELEVPDSVRAEMLAAFSVDYVLYGPAERAEGGYDPSGLFWLKPVFSTPQVAVFRVDRSVLP